MAKYKGIFERYLEAMAKTGDAVLAYQYKKEMFKQSLMDREEREALISDVSADVVKHLSATVDVSEIIQEIDELKKAIDNLGK